MTEKIMRIEDIITENIEDIQIKNLNGRIQLGRNAFATYLELLQRPSEKLTDSSTLYIFSMNYRNTQSNKILLLALPVFAVKRCVRITEGDDKLIIIDIKKKKFWQRKLSMIISAKDKTLLMREGGKVAPGWIYKAV